MRCCEDACHQAWQLKFHPQNHCGGRREVTPASCPPTSIQCAGILPSPYINGIQCGNNHFYCPPGRACVRACIEGWAQWTIKFLKLICFLSVLEIMTTPGKENFRLKSYKNKSLNPDEMRRRREEEGLQLRKQKREEQVSSWCSAVSHLLLLYMWVTEFSDDKTLPRIINLSWQVWK